MDIRRKGYSYLLRPILIVWDTLLILYLGYYYLGINDYFGWVYLGSGYLIIAYAIKFYEVYRFTTTYHIFFLAVKQFLAYLFLLFSYFGIARFNTFTPQLISIYLGISFFAVASVKWVVFFALQKYRTYMGGNIRRVVIFGMNDNAHDLKHLFSSRKELGYDIRAIFDGHRENSIAQGLDFIKNNNIDEVYCVAEKINHDQMNELVAYTDEHYSVLKFIPSTNSLFSKRLQTNYYHYLPILSVPQVALNNVFNRIIKRFFDVVLALFILVFVLSWLTPLLFVLIKLESKGPLFYKHVRNGINYKKFVCYKFRSLRISETSGVAHVTKNDSRVTRIGRFIRKTSIDELPQFYNVLIGNMSVVGPRPHIPRYTKAYAEKIDRHHFVFRHVVKPGITGLAQVKGYRGEVVKDEDIINRISYDLFYIENWTLWLDLKIIVQTLILWFTGDEKAY